MFRMVHRPSSPIGQDHCLPDAAAGSSDEVFVGLTGKHVPLQSLQMQARVLVPHTRLQGGFELLGDLQSYSIWCPDDKCAEDSLSRHNLFHEPQYHTPSCQTFLADLKTLHVLCDPSLVQHI